MTLCVKSVCVTHRKLMCVSDCLRPCVCEIMFSLCACTPEHEDGVVRTCLDASLCLCVSANGCVCTTVALYVYNDAMCVLLLVCVCVSTCR